MAKKMGCSKTLQNGVSMPSPGFGTYQLRPGKQTRQAVLAALQAGYRHIDTAAMYGNEADVGQAVRESGIPRDEVFITTKLNNDDHGLARAEEAFDRSNRTLGLDYIDLYLVHWPVSGLRSQSWKALERVYRDGRCRAIGVSNYTIRHLQELFEQAEIAPMVQQTELSPFLQQKELVSFCQDKGMVLQAYCPLTRAKMMDNPVIRLAASVSEVTPAQVLLRWSVQKGYVPLPKSSNPEHIIENLQICDFELPESSMLLLDALDNGKRVSWNSTNVP